MHCTYRSFRPAIAMIELIFSIVIMGIVMMSAPMLINQASKSGFVALQQEGINEAATRVNMIMGYQWDENNTDEMYLNPILQVSNGDVNLNEDNISTSGRRLGTPSTSYRTFVRPDGLRLNASSTLGLDNNESVPNDMDDFIGTTSLTGASNAGYIETTSVNINTNISYMSDSVTNGTYLSPGTASDRSITFNPNFSAAVGTTNIKYIEVTLTSDSTADELQKTIIFRAFSSNIGGYTLEERRGL